LWVGRTSVNFYQAETPLSVYSDGSGLANGQAVMSVRRGNAPSNGNTIGYSVSFQRIASDISAWYMGADTSNNAVLAANSSDIRIGRDVSGTFADYIRVLNSNGNVGIGTDSPTEKLEVNGNIKSDTGIFDNIKDQSGSNSINVSNIADKAYVNESIAELGGADYFNSITNMAGTEINISTNEMSYKINITNDTTFIFDNSVSNVTGAVSMQLDFDAVYDVTWSNAYLVRNVEYATNTVYNLMGYMDGETWNVIPLSGRSK